jgi:hypothetical protein
MITKLAISELTHTKKGTSFQAIWDDEIPGLGVRVSPGGTKTWIFMYRHRGRRRMKKIAPVSVLTLKEARYRAKNYWRYLLNGQDPFPPLITVTLPLDA